MRLHAVRMTVASLSLRLRIRAPPAAPAREVRQAKALLWAAAEGTAAVGRARAANRAP